MGKTTSTFNLAYALRKLGKKVLAVDFDSQANLTTCFGIEKTNELLGEEYGLSGRTVANLLRINELIPELRDWVDLGKLNFMAAVQLSYASREIQQTICKLGKSISKETATKLRAKGITISEVIDIVCGTQKKVVVSAKSVRIPTAI